MIRRWVLLASLLCAAPVWAFPSTPVITSFTGADEDPLSESSIWSGPILSGMDQMKRASNASKQSVISGTNSGSSYLTTNYGPGSEAYVTIPTWWSHASSDFWLWVCGSGENSSSTSGYQLYANNAGTWVVTRQDNTVGTQLGAALTTQVISNGDAVGVSDSGGTIEAWYKASGGSWTSKGTRSDSTYASGHIGFSKGYIDTTSILDDFGGGTILNARMLTLTGAGQ